MTNDVTILIAEDDEGHFSLIEKNLMRAGIYNEIVRFSDGQEVLDFLFKSPPAPEADTRAYLLLLDIRMPKVDGIKVLEAIKQDEQLRKIPVVMVTTTDDPKEVDRCHSLGCSAYFVKPIEYDDFVDAVQKVGQFLSILSVPQIAATD